jgi:tetratricopeptide (TPR) repeat protein
MLPLLGVLDTNYFAYSLIADHWQYHALPGLILAATTTVATLAQRRPQFASILNAGGIATVLGFTALSSLHLARFEDARSLWTYVVSRNPDAWIAWYNLGNVLSENHEYPRAVAAYRSSLRVKPDYDRCRFNLANALAAAGDLEEANAAYLRSQEIRKDDPDEYNNRAVVLLRLGRADEAIGEFNRALQVQPGKESSLVNLVIIYLRRGQIEKAGAHLSAGVVANEANCRRIADAIAANAVREGVPRDALIQFATRAGELSGNQRDLIEAVRKLSSGLPETK